MTVAGELPNPEWKPGKEIKKPAAPTVALEPESMSAGARYKLMIAAIVPRPIAFVSSANSDGTINLAPFSFFNGVSSNPPCISISFAAHPAGGHKHTLKNIEREREFVVNTCSEWFAEAMVHSAANYPENVSELAELGFTPVASTVVKPPRIAESAVAMECVYYDSLAIGDGSPGSSTLLIGRIVAFHVAESVMEDQRINVNKLKPVGRLGSAGYCTIGRTFDLPIPKLG